MISSFDVEMINPKTSERPVSTTSENDLVTSENDLVTSTELSSQVTMQHEVDQIDTSFNEYEYSNDLTDISQSNDVNDSSDFMNENNRTNVICKAYCTNVCKTTAWSPMSFMLLSSIIVNALLITTLIILICFVFQKNGHENNIQ